MAGKAAVERRGLVAVWCVQGDGEAPLQGSHQPALGGGGKRRLFAVTKPSWAL